MLKTIQMTINDTLLEQVDQASHSLGIARSAFIRQALELALRESKITDLEQKQIAGYKHHPVVSGEFDVWETEQTWAEK
jgi:metal-responsive CopG/Arc/MetJ family transcriptional regulator